MDNNSDVIYRMLVQSVNDYAITMLKPDGIIGSWNQGAQRTIGYTPDEMIGCSFALLYSEEDRRRGLPQRGLDMAATAGHHESEGWRYRKDGSAFWAHETIDPIRNDAGLLVGYACITRDCTQQQEQQRLASKVKKALRYPLIVLSLALLVVLGMLYFVLPEFTAIYQTFSTPLPLLTRMVVAAGDMLSRGWPLLLASLLSPLLLNQLIRRRSDWLLRRQRLLNALPLIGSLIGGQQLSLIFTILALTQSAGISFLQGLQSVEESLSCPLWRQRLAQARALIVQGEPIWQALSRCGGFTPLCLQLIRTGESAGALDQMLENLAHHHREQTYQRADSLAAHLEPMMLVITGSLVGILVVAMYLPVFHLGDAIGGAGG